MRRTSAGTSGSLSTVKLAISLVWSAGRTELLVILGATAITSAVIAGELLVGRELLNLIADSDRVGVDELAIYLAALGVLLLVSAISQSVARELRILLGDKVARRAVDDVLDVATEVELETYEDPEFHDNLERAASAAEGESSGIVFGLVEMISAAFIALGVVGVLFTVVPILVPVAVAGYLPIAYVSVRNNRARYRMQRGLTELEREREYLEYLMTDREEAGELRSYGLAPTLRDWHGSIWDHRLAELRMLVKGRLALSSLASLVTTVVLVATLSFALIMAGRGDITLGDAAVAIVGLQQLSSRLRSTGSSMSDVHEGVMFLRDFEVFKESLRDLRATRPTGTPPQRPVTLTLDGVGYRYPGADDDALKSVSLELRSGQVLAVVGANGSGKSTLMKLICGLLPPTRGTVRLDGIDLASCDPTRIRRLIAPVFQDHAEYLFKLGHTIGVGDVTRMDDSEAILRAAELARADDVVTSLERGLDTRLGKEFSGGTDLSGGQWQRLAIARAFFRDAPILVLDEPSASLDPKAESDLFDLLQTYAKGRIVVFISHRLATVRSADVVMVLDEGDVVELGSHDELIALGGLYHELFNLQAARYGT